MIHVREKPPLRHTIEATSPSGRRYRWADDELQPENIPSALRHSSTMPGGFESLDVTLPRKADVEYGDLTRFATIRVLDATNHVVSEARLERIPQISGDRMAITPSAAGWQAALDDDKTVRWLAIDRELTRWQDISRARQLALNIARQPRGGPSVVPDTTSGLPSVQFDASGPFGGSLGYYAEAWYDAGEANRIGAVQFEGDGTGTGGSATWVASLLAADTDLASGVITVAADNDAADRALATYDLSDPKRWAFFVLAYEAATATDDRRTYDHKNVVVFGDHGLPITGDAGEEGVQASDAIPYALARWAPALRITDESIEPSSFPVPHAAFFDATTVSEIVRQFTRFELQDWAVWEDRTFWMYTRGRGPTRRWRARTGPAQLEETGPQADRVWNAVIVQYQDVDGSTRTVGPAGSGVGTESDFLADLDPANPANLAGLTRRALLQMGTSTPAGAIEVGRRFLIEQKLLDTSGRATLVGHVEDDRGILHPYSHVRAGDLISFPDAADSGYRRIVKADHDAAARSCAIDLDAPPEGLQALLERLSVVLVTLGV